MPSRLSGLLGRKTAPFQPLPRLRPVPMGKCREGCVQDGTPLPEGQVGAQGSASASFASHKWETGRTNGRLAPRSVGRPLPPVQGKGSGLGGKVVKGYRPPQVTAGRGGFRRVQAP